MSDNQLLKQGGSSDLPTADEYDAMSIVDICRSVVAWDDSPEDRDRAIAAIQLRRPGLGHNRPPLDERLDEDFQALSDKADELVTLAEKAVIIDNDSAIKVQDLLKLLLDHADDIETKRKAIAAPYRAAIAVIKSRADAISQPVVMAAGGNTGKLGLRGMLTAWDNKRQAEAEAERQRLLAEQKKREDEAAEAQRKVDEARAAGKGTVTDELNLMQAQDAARRLATRAEAVRPEPLRSNLGQMQRRREAVLVVDDIRKAFTWAIRDQQRKTLITEELHKLIKRHLDSLGIDAVAKGVEIPGCKITVQQGAASVRR